MRAKAGDVITAEARKRLGQARGMPGPWPDAEVATKTDGQAGQWVCTTCGSPFQNNAQAQSHEHAEPAHRLAWLSFGTMNIEEP